MEGIVEENQKEKAHPDSIAELSNLSFGPDWAPTKAKLPTLVSNKKGSTKARPVAKRARRPAAAVAFTPEIAVFFYPEEAVFQRLINAMRSSCKTYQLFDIARLILEKDARFTALLKPLTSKGSEPRKLYLTLIDNIPFQTETTAIDHVCWHHLDQFFETEVKEVDPPKGNFSFVNQCPVTKEFIGPPNYHRYPQLLEAHYASKVSGRMSHEHFLKSIESVKEPEAITQWLEKMRKVARYKLKDSQEGETNEFVSLESVRHFLATRRKDQIIREVDQFKLKGDAILKLPKDIIRRSIEVALERQRRFPIDIATHLRARFHHKHFCMHKKGAKGPYYICAVKRKFRDESTPFTDKIQTLIEFIEQHPMISIAELPAKFLKSSQPTDEANRSPQLEELRQNLNWLIHEGYVAEHENGALFAWGLLKETSTKSNKATQRKKKEEPSAKTTTPLSPPPLPPADDKGFSEIAGNSDPKNESEISP